MAKVPFTLEVDEALYDALLDAAAQAGRSIEEYWSDRLNARIEAFLDAAEGGHA
jgi:predicted HicB family RNase H-like nuclease